MPTIVDSTGDCDPVLDVLMHAWMNFLSGNRLITSRLVAPEASAVITEGNIIRTGFDETIGPVPSFFGMVLVGL